MRDVWTENEDHAAWLVATKVGLSPERVTVWAGRERKPRAHSANPPGEATRGPRVRPNGVRGPELAKPPKEDPLSATDVGEQTAVRPFQVGFPEASSPSCAGASTRPGGPSARRSPTTRRACRSRRCRSSRATGRRTTTGASARRSSTPYRNFITEIDGLDIHFIHVRSQHEDALPLIVTHGWPGSIIEQLKIIEPLTNPTAHGASAADAFHLVIPSLPGHGFSAKPTATGWDPARIARAWVVLMKRLGYTRFVAQGGDWGAAVTQTMGMQARAGAARHPLQHARHRAAEIVKALQRGDPPPSGLSDEERAPTSS